MSCRVITKGTIIYIYEYRFKKENFRNSLRLAIINCLTSENYEYEFKNVKNASQ